MHTPDCPALDPFAHLLGDYGVCTCGAEPAAQPSSDMLLAQRMAKHAAEVSEWLNMVRGPRHVEPIEVGNDDGDYPL